MSMIHDLAERIANSRFVADETRNLALTVIKEFYPWTTADKFEQAVQIYLAASPNIIIALTELVDGPTLANLANDIQGDEQFCSVNAPPSQAANRLLEAFGAPTIVWDNNYRGVKRIVDRVNREARIFNRRKRSPRLEMSGAELNHYGIVVWKEVEALLKVCARFYYRALYQPDDSPVSNAINQLNRAMTLGQILHVIWDLENSIDEDEQARERCSHLVERPSPFQSLLNQSYDLDLTNQEPEWLDLYESYEQRRRQNMTDYGGPYWADVFMADVQIYRNFYAHENEDVILGAGISKATHSFEAARRMLTHMLSSQVANGELVPQLVVPIEQGIDHLSRRTAKLVTASDLNDDGTYSSPLQVYRLAEPDEELSELQLFQFYLCCPVYELALNPILIPLREIRPETLRGDE
jgi:hypothetical protein